MTQNSVYEIHEWNHMIRRASGANDPTARQGKDGVWREYMSIMPHFGGLLIVWGTNDDGTSACTWTSVIVSDVTNPPKRARWDPPEPKGGYTPEDF